MTDYGNNNQKQAPSYAQANASQRGNETALMIEGLYNGLAYDLQKMKKELVNELKYNALQSSSLYESIQKDYSSAADANAQTAQSMVLELRYGYQQNQMIYDSLAAILNDDVISRLDTIDGKLELLERIDQLLQEIKEKLEGLDGEAIARAVVEALPVQEEIDYDKITESVSEKTETSVATHSKEILDAVAAIPVAENVDYVRIEEEVSDKVVEKLRDVLPKEAEVSVSDNVDYDRIIYGAAEKVVESLPYPDKVDYNRIDENFMKAAESFKAADINEEALAANVAAAVAQAIAEMDTDTLAEAVASKIVLPEVKAEELDYDKLSDMIIAKLPAPAEPEPIDYDLLAETIISRMPAPVEPEPIDYDKLAEAIVARMPEGVDYEKISETVAERIPQSETFDYAVMAQTVVERMPVAPQIEAVDYDRMYQAAKAAQTTPDPVDYDRIAEIIQAKLSGDVNYDLVVDEEGKKALAKGVAEEVDYNLLADLVAEKIAEQSEAPTYDVVVDEDGAKAIADSVASAIDFEGLTDRLAGKVQIPATEIVLPEPEALDYEALSDKVAEKIAVPTYDILIDEESTEKIADAVAEKLHDVCAIAAQAEKETEEAPVEEAVEAPVAEEVAETETEVPMETAAEETVEEVVEEPVTEELPEEATETAEEIVEEETAEAAEEAVEEPETEEVAEIEAEQTEEPAEMVAEEVAEEVVEEPAVEETAEEVAATETEILSQSESTIETEIAVSAAEAVMYEEVDDNLVDADTGLVLRLKRSFTAKMKQSEPTVKHYYSEIKNELTSYKRLNSNLSWHGDRFNFGRETVAKVNICGKTLCFYLALDPNDPEYKTTVYHQRDVGGQRAYETTPFMVKVKSDAALKKAVRLVGFLAEKLGTEKIEGFEPVDYIEEFRHESTKQLLEAGLIKVTKEKKVVLDFN